MCSCNRIIHLDDVIIQYIIFSWFVLVCVFVLRHMCFTNCGVATINMYTHGFNYMVQSFGSINTLKYDTTSKTVSLVVVKFFCLIVIPYVGNKFQLHLISWWTLSIKQVMQIRLCGDQRIRYDEVNINFLPEIWLWYDNGWKIWRKVSVLL